MGWLEASLGAASSIAGGLFGNASAAREAARQREWQENFYKNRHQWEVADLRAAGLNPMLSANSAGSVPSGAAAAQGNVAAGAADAFASVSNAKTQKKLAEQQGDVMVSQALKNAADAELAKTQQGYYTALEAEAQARTPMYQVQMDNIKQVTAKILNDIKNSDKITDATVKKMAADAYASYQAGGMYAADSQLKINLAINAAAEHDLITEKTANEIKTGVSLAIQNDMARNDLAMSNYSAKNFWSDTPYGFVARTAKNVGDILGAAGSGFVGLFK